jgi:hypothetical protein
MTRAARDTPMMRQFLSVKAQHPDAIVFYRMGDFYEMFLSDAEIAAPLLDITLTTRDRDKTDAVPMCGIPVHAADPHIKRLAELGYRIAICEQVEDAKAVAGRRLVKEVVGDHFGLVGNRRIDGTRELCLVLFPVAVAILDVYRRISQHAGRLRSGRRLCHPPFSKSFMDPREIQSRAIILLERNSEVDTGAARMHRTGVLRSIEVDAPSRASTRRDATPQRAAAALLAYVAANQPFAFAYPAAAALPVGGHVLDGDPRPSRALLQ